MHELLNNENDAAVWCHLMVLGLR